MDANTEILRRLDNLIATGTVAEVQYDPPRCRVAIGARSTDWLAWVEPCAGETRTWHPPTIGEQVTVLSPSGEVGAGLVLRGLPSDAKPTPSANPDEHVTLYPDGARVAYNHATGALSATGVKTATVQGTDSATVDFPQATFTGDVLINGRLTVQKLLSYNGGMAGQGGDAGGTVIHGPINHQGGSLSSNGVVVDRHDHGGVQRGGDRTDGPQ